MFELANPHEDAAVLALKVAANIVRCRHEYQLQMTAWGWQRICMRCATLPLWERGH